MPTPAELSRIADLLAAMSVVERVDLAKRAGVRPQLAHRVAEMVGRENVKPFEGRAFVQLCAALKVDPITGVKIDIGDFGPFLPEHFAVAVKLARMTEKLTQREAAKVWGVEKTIPYRAEKAIPISVEPLLDLCAALNRHPFEFMRCTMFNAKHDLRQKEPVDA